MSDVSTSAVAPCPPRFRVLTVCTGNLYRSPLAERLLRERLAAAGEVIQVSSAGTRAVPDARRPDEAARFTGEGGEGDGAVTRRLSAGLVQGADLVLGAATEHREAAVRLAPAWALSRAFSLREFARLVRAEDATGTDGPAARMAALVAGAAARRGAAGADGTDDDVPDPLGASEAAVRECVARIEEAVDRVAAALLGE